MTKIVELLIVIFLIWLSFTVLSLIWARTRLVGKINRLKVDASAQITYNRLPHISLLRLSRTPDLTVRAGNTLYLVRLYNGGGIDKVVHFASPDFTVKFSRMKTASYTSRSRGGTVFSRLGFSVGARVIPISRLDTSRYEWEKGVKVVPVLIFSPAPGEVSFVTEEKTSIMVAFTGDEIYGTRIFTVSTFVSYVERAYREERRIAEEQRALGKLQYASLDGSTRESLYR